VALKVSTCRVLSRDVQGVGGDEQVLDARAAEVDRARGGRGQVDDEDAAVGAGVGGVVLDGEAGQALVVAVDRLAVPKPAGQRSRRPSHALVRVVPSGSGTMLVICSVWTSPCSPRICCALAGEAVHDAGGAGGVDRAVRGDGEGPQLAGVGEEGRGRGAGGDVPAVQRAGLRDGEQGVVGGAGEADDLGHARARRCGRV
jgi:hypothetical protein